MDIASDSRRGLKISFASQMVKFGLQFGLSIVLARLLRPGDFGLVAMAAPLIVFAQLFSDLGLAQATVLRKDISQDELSFTFWTIVAVSAGAALLLALSAPLAILFYREARVGPIVMVLGATVLLSGLAAQHTALLNRNLRFGALAGVELGGFATGAVAGIAAALAGLSYWAVVVNQVVVAVASMVIAWSLSGWRPSLPRRIAGARSLLGLGGNVTGFNLVNFFARNLDNLLIGRTLGEAPLGLYDRAYKLLLLPLSQITGPIAKVAVPMLARSADDPAIYRKRYTRLLETILLLTYPGVIVAGVASGPLIANVLGPQWSGAAPVFRILAIGALFAPIGNSTGWLFMTQDRTREMRNIGVGSSIAFVASFVAGLPWGIVGVAAAYIAVGAIQGPVVWWLATRKGPVGFGHLLETLMPFAFAAVPVGLLAAYVCMVTQPGWLLLGTMAGAGYLVFIAGMSLFPRGRQILIDAWGEVKLLRKVRPQEALA